MAIIDSAKRYMIAEGNPTQWSGKYPDKDVISRDISLGHSYIIEENGRPAATFCFATGHEPNYDKIDGSWINDDDYATIHRLASDGSLSGVADICLEFCLNSSDNIRIDTHADNLKMRKWISSKGFVYCGIIKVSDGSPRLAFQLERLQNEN